MTTRKTSMPGTRKSTIRTRATRTSAPLVARETLPPTHDAIARRAYEIFEARGYGHGDDLSDWLQAEAELRG